MRRAFRVAKSVGWEELGVSKESIEATRGIGWAKPTDVQRASYSALLQGKDAVICAPTGTGKTGSFLIPIGERIRIAEDKFSRRSRPHRPKALVLAPSRELAIQIHRDTKVFSHHHRYRSHLAVGGASGKVLRRELKRGGVDVLVGTPGRILAMLEKGELLLSDVLSVVVDEADTLTDDRSAFLATALATSPADAVSRLSLPSGTSLRMATASVGHFAATVGAILQPIRASRRKEDKDVGKGVSDDGGDDELRTQMVFSAATMSAQQHKTLEQLSPGIALLTGGALHTVAPSLTLKTMTVASSSPTASSRPRAKGGAKTQDPLDAALDVLQGWWEKQGVVGREGGEAQTAIVFTNSVDSARAVGHLLEENMPEQCKVWGLHGGIPAPRRKKEWEGFRERGGVLVATDAAARGIHLPTCDLVLLFDFPRSPPEFLHRVGRTARAENNGRAVLFVRPKQQRIAQALLQATKTSSPILPATNWNKLLSPTSKSPPPSSHNVSHGLATGVRVASQTMRRKRTLPSKRRKLAAKRK